MKAWFADDSAEPEPVAEFRRSVGEIDLGQVTRLGTSVYNRLFNLLVLSGARDWVSGNVPQHDDLDDHYIVPKSLGSEYALNTSIDTILNRTPLTSRTNREVIRDRLPNAYLPELVAKNGEAEILKILEPHFISRRAFEILVREPFTPGGFEEFVQERRDAFRKRLQCLAGQG